MYHLSRSMVLVFCILSISGRNAEARRIIPEDNLSYPVSIQLDGRAASGFYIVTGKHEYLVTARHVLFNENNHDFILKASTAELFSYPRETGLRGRFRLKVDLRALYDAGNIELHDGYDISFVRPGTIIPHEGGGMTIEYLDGVNREESVRSGTIGVSDLKTIKKFDEVLIGNEVFVFGFPRSLGIEQIPQLDYERPLHRKGIIAGKNDSLKTIILDCPIYGGNSGGPVLEVEPVGITKTQFRIIGVISQFVPFKETWVNRTQGYSYWTLSNSGYSVAIPMDALFELLPTDEQ